MADKVKASWFKVNTNTMGQSATIIRDLFLRPFMSNLAIYFNKIMKSKHMLWEYPFSF